MKGAEFHMNNFSGNHVGLYFASPACQPVPLTNGHLSCRDSFAWSRGCPAMTGTGGTTVLESMRCHHDHHHGLMEWLSMKLGDNNKQFVYCSYHHIYMHGRTVEMYK